MRALFQPKFILALLLLLMGAHAVGACVDMITAIRYPYGLDYGEGIVWQQEVLIPGPRMYGTSPVLPFIVFHYPPGYYLAVRLANLFVPDTLAAGRLVSCLATLAIAALVAGLVFATSPATSGAGERASLRWRIAVAVVAGLTALSLHAVRNWGLFMRVDMIAVALSLAGLGVAVRSDSGFRAIAIALLLCVASTYCKQTELPVGVAIFLAALVRRPRAAIGAGALALAAGLGLLMLMQHATGGGFLANIIGNNINRFTLADAMRAGEDENRSLLFVFAMIASAFAVARRLPHRRLRTMDQASWARALILLVFLLETLMLVTVFKSGGTYNYFIEFLCIGTVLTGIWLNQALRGREGLAVKVFLVAGAVMLPLRLLPADALDDSLAVQAALVARIAAATRPVASEDMTLLMRAGKPVIFEPSIATELAMVGRWDEAPLVAMIRDHGFAFMITTDDDPATTRRRTPAVDGAMRAAYPRVERVAPQLWLHLPLSP